MLAALLLQAAVPQTAVDAERAFNAAAQAEGQWTAFRKFAADEGVMFVPQLVKAQDWLKDRKDPPSSVEWWPIESYVSCDGGTAVNTGGWTRPDGSVGYFTTVWKRQADGSWKWLLDQGDSLKAPLERLVEPKVTKASCEGRGPLFTTPWSDGTAGAGYSSDRSLFWHWAVGKRGDRTLEVRLWNGKTSDIVFDRAVAAPTQ